MKNMFDMLKQASQFKKQASQLQKMLSSKEYEEVSKDGKIKIKINGRMNLIAIDISSDLLFPENKIQLEKTILNTWHSAQKEVERILQSELKNQFGDLPFDNMPF